MIRIRVDDFPNTKDGEKDKHSLAAYREFHRCLSECIGGKRYLLGVIPKRSSVEDILFLRNETDVIVGMHGLEHDEAKLDVYQNEFAPFLSMEEIGRLLREGREGLQSGVGRQCQIYMPPRNKIDMRTIMMLGPTGFWWFTAGPETDIQIMKFAKSKMILSYPPNEYGRTDELFQQEAHVHLRQFKGDSVLTLHWTWETNIGLEHMRRFFAEIPKELFSDFDS